MSQIREIATNLSINSWKYAYKFSNSSSYNETGKSLVELSQAINIDLFIAKDDNSKLEEVKEKVFALDALLERLKNIYPNEFKAVSHLKQQLLEMSSYLNVGLKEQLT